MEEQARKTVLEKDAQETNLNSFEEVHERNKNISVKIIKKDTY